MSNPAIVTKQLAASSATAIALAQAVAAAGALTINGATASGGVATLDTQRRVLITSTSAGDGAVVFTVNGTNESGAPISEKVTGVVNAAPVATVQDFLTVTSVTADRAAAGNISVGTNGTGSTAWIAMNFLAPSWYLSIAVMVASANPATFTVEHTYDDPNANANSQSNGGNFSMAPASSVPPVVWSLAALNGKSANTEAQYTGQPVMAVRLTITAGTTQCKMWATQAGIGSP